MSLRDIELQNTLTKINKLEAILSLTILKHENPENIAEVNELLSDAKHVLYDDKQIPSNLNRDEQIKIIKKRLENKEVQEKVSNFDFNIKTFSLQSILDDLSQFDLKLGDYIETIGSSNLVYLNKLWLEGSVDYKSENLRDKYVKVADISTRRQCFNVSSSCIYGIQREIKQCLSYLDSEKKIFNWEQIMLDLKSLAKSSGFATGDVQLALLGLIRLANLNQDLYTDLTINEIAQTLINSVKPIHKTTILWNSLRSLERAVNTPLQLILSESESYIKKIFPEDKQKKIRESYFFIALTSFINDKLSLEVSNDIKRKKEMNEEYCYETYKNQCMRLELDETNIPKKILKYGRNIKESTVQEDTLYNITLNNIHNKPFSSLEENDEEQTPLMQTLHRPIYNTYDEVTYENVHETRNDRLTQNKYNDNNMTYRDVPESRTNRHSYIDRHYDGNFRDNIVNIRDLYPRFRQGRNCNENYHPYDHKFCRKCTINGDDSHHEFNCKYFELFNNSNCNKCRNGFHFEEDCDLDTSYKKNG